MGDLAISNGEVHRVVLWFFAVKDGEKHDDLSVKTCWFNMLKNCEIHIRIFHVIQPMNLISFKILGCAWRGVPPKMLQYVAIFMGNMMNIPVDLELPHFQTSQINSQ